MKSESSQDMSQDSNFASKRYHRLREYVRACVAMIRVRKVIKDSKINREYAHRGTGDGDGGNDPMDRRKRRPSKPK